MAKIWFVVKPPSPGDTARYISSVKSDPASAGIVWNGVTVPLLSIWLITGELKERLAIP